MHLDGGDARREGGGGVDAEGGSGTGSPGRFWWGRGRRGSIPRGRMVWSNDGGRVDVHGWGSEYHDDGVRGGV